MNPIVSWLFALIVAFAPPDKAAQAAQFPGHEETAEQKIERYKSIAQDLYDVVYDPEVEPVYPGSKGRARTALLMVAIAFHESGFAHDVDIGPCYRGRDGQSARCDHGRSACIMQMHIGGGTTPEGYTQAELFADRKKCLRSALARIRSSMGECKALDEKHRLNAYASGVCTRGDEQSEELASFVEKFAARVPMPAEDDATYMKAPASPGKPAEAPPAPPASDASKPRDKADTSPANKASPPRSVDNVPTSPSRKLPRRPALRPNRTRSVAVER